MRRSSVSLRVCIPQQSSRHNYELPLTSREIAAVAFDGKLELLVCTRHLSARDTSRIELNCARWRLTRICLQTASSRRVQVRSKVDRRRTRRPD